MTADLKVGERLKNSRKEVDLTIRELARRTGLSASFISQVERGKANLSIDSLRQVAKCLDISIHYFLSEDENTAETHADREPRGEDELIQEYSPVVRAECRSKVYNPNFGVEYELLTNDLNHKMEPFFRL